MGKLTFDITMSLDGFVAGPNQSLEQPLGNSGERLHEWQALAAAGDRNVSVAGGASVVQQYLKAGLLDEFQIHLAPIVLGGGVRLFDQLGAAQVELETTGVVESPAITHLRFRVVK